MGYPCNGVRRCKHLAFEYSVANMLNGDSHVGNPQWRCAARDDERCVPNCNLYQGEPCGSENSRNYLLRNYKQ